MPLTATECFEGHPRPGDLAPWVVWVCPEDGELVIPDDVNRDEVAAVNRRHPLLGPKVSFVHMDEPVSPDLDLDDSLKAVVFRSQTDGSADPNDMLVTIAAPILTGFALAAIVTIGTSKFPAGRPAALPAVACFAASAVLFLFSIQMLAIGRVAGLTALWSRIMKGALFELGLLALLAGLGLFLWLKTWPAAAIASVAVVGLAVLCDVALTLIAWSRRDQPLSLRPVGVSPVPSWAKLVRT